MLTATLIEFHPGIIVFTLFFQGLMLHKVLSEKKYQLSTFEIKDEKVKITASRYKETFNVEYDLEDIDLRLITNTTKGSASRIEFIDKDNQTLFSQYHKICFDISRIEHLITVFRKAKGQELVLDEKYAFGLA